MPKKKLTKAQITHGALHEKQAIDLLREYDPPAGISYEGGALLDDLLFVAAHQRGVDLLDVAEPGPITLVTTIDLGQNAAWDVEVIGDYLLVANGRYGLSVVDLTMIPPEVVATVPMPGLANDLIVSGSISGSSASGS